MYSFHDWSVTGLLALVFACIIAKLVSVALCGGDGNNDTAKVDADRVVKVVEQVKLGEGLRVKGSKSKKRVNFVDHVVIRHVDQFGLEEEKNDTDEEIKRMVYSDNDVCEKGSETMEGMIAEENIETVKTLMCIDDLNLNEVGVNGDDDSSKRDVVEGNGEVVDIYEPLSIKEVDVVVRGIDDLFVEFGNAVAALGQKLGSVALGIGENVDGMNKWAEDRRVKKDVVDDEDDWEGVERTELQRVFAEAVNYVECGVKEKVDLSAKLGTDLQIHLYGLHKIALEGSCHEPQPMVLNFSARAKWNAWQKLGSMTPEVAMEEYIELLTEAVPGWMQLFHDEQISSESRMLDDAEYRSSFQGSSNHISCQDGQRIKIEDELAV